jgi:plasmid stability protein
LVDLVWYHFGYTEGGTAMATLTIKDVPEPLVRRLKARATLHRRSLNREVIASLEALVDPEALLARAREVRRAPAGGRLTDRTLERLKSAGRA